MYSYMYTWMYIYIYRYMNTYIHIYMYMYIYICIHPRGPIGWKYTLKGHVDSAVSCVANMCVT